MECLKQSYKSPAIAHPSIQKCLLKKCQLQTYDFQNLNDVSAEKRRTKPQAVLKVHAHRFCRFLSEMIIYLTRCFVSLKF